MEENKQPKKFYQQRWFLITIVVVIGLIILSKISPNQNVIAPENASSTSQNSNSVINISAEKLMKEYEENEVAADQKYKNKLIEVSGTIENIGKDLFENPYIALETDPEDEFSLTLIQCGFKKSDEAQLASLIKGKKITLQGTGDGILLNIQLKNCKIVK